MTNQENETDADPAAALIGTPVERQRKVEGVSQAQYLKTRPGDQTRSAMRAAGLVDERYKRGTLPLLLVLAAVTAVAGAGLLLYLW